MALRPGRLPGVSDVLLQTLLSRLLVRELRRQVVLMLLRQMI